jgi:hypothetical protein
MDFFQITEKHKGKAGDRPTAYPIFLVSPPPKDLMVRGGKFYAMWDEEAGLWTTNEFRLYEVVDRATKRYSQEHDCEASLMGVYNSQVVTMFRRYCNDMPDNFVQLDSDLIFAGQTTKREDYASRTLPYALGEGDISAWDELIGTLYSPEERLKIEWAIGAIVSGDSKKLQKFIAIVGDPGTGKSTVLNIIEDLFESYVATFDAKALGSANSAFSTAPFKLNPLVAIQHDGDLSRIEDNSRLNSIVSHDQMLINEKFTKAYPLRINSFLFMGTNREVKISEARSGLLRRLVDVHPLGVQIPSDRYVTLLNRIKFEHGAIAFHCLQVYRKLGLHYYDQYRPLQMMYATNFFINFIVDNYDELAASEGVSTKRAYELYKKFALENGMAKYMPRHTFQAELRAYYEAFHERYKIGDIWVRNVFVGFRKEKLSHTPTEMPEASVPESYLDLKPQRSLLDDFLADQPAQYANREGLPRRKWQDVEETLDEINTSKLHYVLVPEHHIVIDFDLKDEDGNKSLELNLKAAEEWPATYAEVSQGGSGLHLSYIYEGDVSELQAEYAPGIEIKTLRGHASLRRRLSKCNDTPIATLTSGLPQKERRVIHEKTMKSERTLRDLIQRNLRKEINPSTKSSIDFIKKILDDAYESDMAYDVTDLKPRVIAFANKSTNRSLECLKTVTEMKFASEKPAEQTEDSEETRVVFFDVEVYPNLFVVCWKYDGDSEVVRMINPSAEEVARLFRFKLVGFNNRRYDNHILYARSLGYSNLELFNLSDRMINGTDRRKNAGMFGEAYGLSYTDIYDFSSKKQGLKKFQIELGLQHMELDIPWDQPVPEERFDDVASYCANDVVTTEAVFHARHEDFVARQILAELSGLTVNDSTQKHTAKIIFGDDRHPQASFIYTDLSEMFPGYEYDSGKSTYRGEDPSEGGYVYAEPGIYEDVAVLDVASMHPTSIIELDLFGREYTRRFRDLVSARLAIKNREYEKARRLFDGKLEPFLVDSDNSADSLAYALKIVVNIVYGLTSAKFDNAFRDNRNKDNIVAKRGALFMIDLKHALQEKGYSVVHIKTDSVKIPGGDPEVIKFVQEFGARYGYTFEHETTYDKFCLVNDAVYIARAGDHWEAVGAQFQHPYVYKSLFTGEQVEFKDLCETKSVQKGAIYISFDPDSDDMHFVGRTGSFVPVTPDGHGGALYRVHDGKKYALPGTKGYLWLEESMVKAWIDQWLHIDLSYYTNLVEEAVKTIEKFGSFQRFIS